MKKEQPISGYALALLSNNYLNVFQNMRGSYFLFPLIISRSSFTMIDRIPIIKDSISKSLMSTTSIFINFSYELSISTEFPISGLPTKA